MAKGIKIVESNTNFEDAPDGNHFVKGFEFITTDESGAPHFVPDQYKGMVVRIKFINVVDNQPAPAMSLKPAEFIALVRLFGANDFAPTKQNRELAPVLLEGMRKANEHGQRNTLSVYSSKGWVNYIDGMRLPEGRYKVKYSGSYPRDHEWLEGNNGGQYINLYFDVVDDTLWEGFTIKVSLSNVFLQERQDEEGMTHTAREDGMPIFAGGVNQRRWENFGTYFCNDIWKRHDWQAEPSKSRWGICEVEEPHKVLLKEAEEIGAEVEVWYEKKERSDGYHFEMADLAKFNTVSQQRTADAQEFIDFVKSRKWTYVDEDTEEEVEITNIFESENPLTFVLNGDGKSEWARRFLSVPWQTAGLNMDDRRFDILTPADYGKLMDAMESMYK